MVGATSPEGVEAEIRAISDAMADDPASARERILCEAVRLFYERGIRAVGVDLVIARSGVAKATFYRHFPSKSDLVLAYVDRRQTAWATWLRRAVRAPRLTPAERLLAVFDALGERCGDRAFRGDAAANAVVEVGADVPAVVELTRVHRAHLLAFLLELAAAAAVDDPPAFAARWLLLVEGSLAAAACTPGDDAVEVARTVASELLAGAVATT